MSGSIHARSPGKTGLAHDSAQEWSGTAASRPNLEPGADDSWPSTGLGADVCLPNLEMRASSSRLKLGLGNKKDIALLWVVIHVMMTF